MAPFVAPGVYRGRPPYSIGGRPPWALVLLAVLAAAAVSAVVFSISNRNHGAARPLAEPHSAATAKQPPSTAERPRRPAPDAASPPSASAPRNWVPRSAPAAPREEPSRAAPAPESAPAPAAPAGGVGESSGGRRHGWTWHWPKWGWGWGLPSFALLFILCFGPGWFWLVEMRRVVWTVVTESADDKRLLRMLARVAGGGRRDLAILAVADGNAAKTYGPVQAADARALLRRSGPMHMYSSLPAAIKEIRASIRGRHRTLDVAEPHPDAARSEA